MAGELISEELAERYDLSQFHSGKTELDDWLRHFAHHAKDNRTGRTFVWHDGRGVVVAYYTLVGHEVARDDLPRKVSRGSPDRIPAVLLARLALDHRFHSRGLGAELLVEALTKAVEASHTVAARVVVVDAIDDEAATFYTHYGFIAIPTNPHRLVQKMSAIESAYYDT